MTSASFVLLLGASLSLANCAGQPQAPPGPMSAPVPDNETRITAEVVEAKVVDSATLNIQPKQPIVVLRLRLLSVPSAGGDANFLNHKPGEIVTVYSKEPTAAAFHKKSVRATVSFRGDERGGSFWAHEIAALSAK